MILNSVFKEVVTVNKDEEFEGCTFESGTVAKQKGVFGLSINGDANVSVKNCKFKNKGYSGIFMNSTGKINIENNTFDCTGLYNPIEGGSGTSNAKLDNVIIKNNLMNGICGNNYINFYHMKDNAVITIADNTITGMSQQAEVVRLSNLENAQNVTFNISGTKYYYDMTTAFSDKWTKMFLLQDYTGNKGQDFSQYTLNVSDTYCNGTKVTDKDNFPVGGLFTVYDNKANGGSSAAVITDNDPVVNFS